MDGRFISAFGVVVAIPQDGATLTIDHEETEGAMAAMQMTHAVKAPLLVEHLSVGDRIRFSIDQVDSTICAIQVMGRQTNE